MLVKHSPNCAETIAFAARLPSRSPTKAPLRFLAGWRLNLAIGLVPTSPLVFHAAGDACGAAASSRRIVQSEPSAIC